jgi:DNA polymerase-3 subunit alpha
VLQVPYAEADRLAKMIPPPVQGRHIPLAKSLKDDAALKEEYSSNQDSKRVFDLAIQLEGTIRSHGVHAAGVVIAPEDIVHYTPLEMAQKGVVATQYSMGPIEELGLLKMDFLGLSNLTILNNTLRIIKKVYKQRVVLNEIPIDDPKTFELLQRGDTTGVFQVESAGMKRYLKELQPTLFEDIIAMNALYRPGPMAEIPRFIKGKNNAKSVEYLHDSLKPILEDTYGVMVYQEQITQLLQLVAGYTAGEADLVRKAIGKKKRDIMQAEEPRFIEGCIKKGLTKSDAQKLWEQIQPFADYSFNRAHATCYAQISYWTAYLKANYPEAFMAALMTSDYDDTDRLAIEITECKHMGITVLPPDVNESFVEFAVVPGKKQIRFGLAAIKNVGTGAVQEILRARGEDHFKNLEDFLSKVDSGIVNRKAMESLIKAGAFDNMGDRDMLLHNLEAIMAFTSRLQKQVSSGQTDLFGAHDGNSEHRYRLELQVPPNEPDSHQQLQWERELLGLYLSQHPLEAFETFLAEHTVPLGSLEAGHDGQSVTIGGIVTSVRDITTRNGRRMAFIKLEDLAGELEIILFPGSYEQFAPTLQQDKVVLIKGKVNGRDREGNINGEVKVNVENAKEITIKDAENYHPTGRKKELVGPAANPPAAEKVYIRLANTEDEDKLVSLKKTIDTHKGDTEVVLVLGQNASKQAIKLPGGINRASDEGLSQLKELVGTDNLVIR